MASKPRPMTAPEFMARFATEDVCRDYLRHQRWPDGVHCPKCGGERVYTLENRPLWECAACRYQFSVTVGTVMQDSKLPLQTWFLAMFLNGQSKRGISAMELRKQLGVCYESAWYLLRRIRLAMSQREREHLLQGMVEMDDAYFGGVCEGRYGRGTDQAKAAVAVSVNEQGYPAFAKVRILPSFLQEDVNAATLEMIKPATRILTDGLSSWGGLATIGYDHKPVVIKDLPDGVEPFPYVHTFISNAKAWIAGTFHGLGTKYLQEYLDEFSFRFYRRRMEPRIFERLVHAVGCSIPQVVVS